MGQTVSLCGNLWFAWLSGTINTQVQRLFLKCRPATPTRTRHVPGHRPCSQRVHSPGPQGRRTACLQPPVGAGVPGSPRACRPLVGWSQGSTRKCFLGWTLVRGARQKLPFLTVWPSQSPACRDRRVDGGSLGAWVWSSTLPPSQLAERDPVVRSRPAPSLSRTLGRWPGLNSRWSRQTPPGRTAASRDLLHVVRLFPLHMQQCP